MSDLAPYEPARPPERGAGPRELWRHANVATRGTVLGVLLVLLVAGSFLAGRLTAPGDGSADAAAAPVTTEASPADVAQARRDDEAAKAVARDVVAFVASCAAVSPGRSYAPCRTAAQLNVGSTLPLVDDRDPGAGEVAVSSSRDGYRVVSVSVSGNRFTLAQEGTADPVRTCSDGGVANAGCIAGVW